MALALGACISTDEEAAEGGEVEEDGRDVEEGGGGEHEADAPPAPEGLTVDGEVVSFEVVADVDGYALVDGDRRLTVAPDTCDGGRCEVVLQARAGFERIQVVAVREGVDSAPSDAVDLQHESADFEPPPSTYVVRFVEDVEEEGELAEEDENVPEDAAETAPIEVIREEFDDVEQAEVHVEEMLDEPGVLSAAVERSGELHAEEAPPADPSEGSWYLDTLALDGFGPAADGGGVVIAVLDTGVDASHPALDGRVLEGTTTSEPGTPGTTYPRDHGTAVAGLLVGDGTGAAPGAQVLPVDLFGARDGFTTGDLVWGIVWAVDNGADLINISAAVACGDGGDDCELELAGIDDAIGYAERNGVLVVTSAGNDGAGAGCDSPTNAIAWPANLTLAVTVGGTQSDGSRWDCSPDGGHVDVLAPAEDLQVLRSTADGGPSRSIGAGTSFAAPLVTGVAARLLGMDGDLSPMVLRMALTNHPDEEGAMDVGAVLQVVLALGDIESSDVPDDRAPEVRTSLFTLVREGFPELRGEFDTFDPDVPYHGYVTIREDGTVDGFGRTGVSFGRPDLYAWSCGDERGSYRIWNPVEVSGTVLDDGALDLEFHFPEPGPLGYTKEWIIRGDPYCHESIAESHERLRDHHEVRRDRIGDIRIERYETSGATDQVFEIDGEEIQLALFVVVN